MVSSNSNSKILKGDSQRTEVNRRGEGEEKKKEEKEEEDDEEEEMK